MILPAGANSSFNMFSGIVVAKHLYIYIHASLYICLFLLYKTVETFLLTSKNEKVVGYKGGITKYLSRRKKMLGLRDPSTLVLEEHAMDIYLLKCHSFFHSTNVYKVSPENKALRRMQRGIHKNPSFKGVLVLIDVIV